MNNKLYLFYFLILIISCSKKKDSSDVNSVDEKDSIETIENVKPIVENTETDCVFDNKPKELTQEWLKEIGFEKFTWDKKNSKAILIQDLDTLLVFKGGCNHLMKSVEINTENQYEDILDLKLLQKINDVACQFKFVNYCNKIINNEFEKVKSANESFILEFVDDDPDDNLIYSGIEIKAENKRLHITISEYYN